MMDQPGKLYLGREFDLAAKAASDAPFMLPMRDLTTHAVCLGMAGAGKTGLGICLLEEVLLQGTPVIIIDAKDDLTHLAPSVPDLRAEQTATHGKNELTGWGIGAERIREFQDRTAFQLFTPGGNGGIGVNVLNGLNPPGRSSGLTWEHDAESLRERITQIVSALLDLAGIVSDPLNGREHILLSTIFETTWRVGESIDISMLIRMIQDPPVGRIGAFDMNVFYPKDERFELAMALNNLMASQSFSAMHAGQPLDIPFLLAPLRSGGANPAGRTRANIFSLAHLGDAERRFFISLLLSQLVLWMRTQTGTSVLRCLVYFDEASGYYPPLPSNPPARASLMTIIKQGRAAGLGMVLGTQFPAELDYKGLSTIGTWFIGRLQTTHDRLHALEGLESAGVYFDRTEYEAPLCTLPSGVFLAKSPSGASRFFQTRLPISNLPSPISNH